MRITRLKNRLAQHHRTARQQRELYRAIDAAPTPASRQELLALLGR